MTEATTKFVVLTNSKTLSERFEDKDDAIHWANIWCEGGCDRYATVYSVVAELKSHASVRVTTFNPLAA